MNILDQTKFLLKEYDLSPNKLRGQNFLISEKVLEDIIKISDLKENENILEVGPGLGILTNALLDTKVNLISIEVDDNFIPILEKIKKVSSNFNFIKKDVLKLNLEKEIDKNFLKNYKIIANLPYNITSRFIRIFLESDFAPKKMTLMLQKEVAQRIINYDKKWSKLSVMCNFYSEPKIDFYVSRKDFYPSPDVDSAIISFSNISNKKYKVDSKKFFQVVNIGFSSKRRTLINNLSSGFKIEKNELEKIFLDLDLDINIRAEKLCIDDWIKLYEKFKNALL